MPHGHRLRRFQLASLLLALGLPVPSLAHQAGPLPAGPSSPAVSQDVVPQKQPPPPSAAVSSQPTKPAAAPATPILASTPTRIQVPTGTHIPLVLHNAISTRSARPGDPVYFETLFPVLVEGRVVIPAGSYVSGEITESKRPGRIKGRAELMIKLTTMILPNAYMVDLRASPSGSGGTGGGESVDKEGKIRGDSDKTSDIGTVAKTTGAGAGIGAISAGAKGAGIGAGIGAAAGLMGVLLSRGPEAELPRGSTLDVVTDRPIFLDAGKVQFSSPGQASSLPGPPNREPEGSKVPF